MESAVIAVAIGCIALVYATAGQAGGTAFLAVMAFAGLPADDMRPTALLLNIVAAACATWRLRQSCAIEMPLLIRLTIPSLLAAFLGGLITMAGRTYFMLTGGLLIVAALLMLFRRRTNGAGTRQVQLLPAAALGAGAGFVSGVTGVGGGVFLTPALILFGWTSAKRAAVISPPFILCNSIAGLSATLLAGQQLARGSLVYALGALAGAALGTTIGRSWMSERAVRCVLAATLAFAGLRMLSR